jgi:uracil-DNA glycosylase
MDMHVYVTNVAKRRPPDNRNPTPDEIAFYLPLLFEEIRLVDPTIIILAGAIPLKAVLDVTGITKVRGQWFSTELMGRSRMVMPVFHPSYLLRNATKKFDMKVRRTLHPPTDIHGSSPCGQTTYLL